MTIHMKDLLDVHTHTLASGHAYSSLREMAMAAKAKGLKLLGIADHGPKLPDTFGEFYFCNFKVIPREADLGYGIDLVMGVELDIIDYAGSTDLRGDFLERMDYAIASLHDPCIKAGTREQNTAALLGAMKNPKVKIIGHPDNPKYPVDFRALARAAREQHVLLELNNSSYVPGGSRQGSRELAGELMAAARAEGAMVILGSDAHIEFDVGRHDSALELVRQYDFPEELIINSDPAAFKEWIKE